MWIQRIVLVEKGCQIKYSHRGSVDNEINKYSKPNTRSGKLPPVKFDDVLEMLGWHKANLILHLVGASIFGGSRIFALLCLANQYEQIWKLMMDRTNQLIFWAVFLHFSLSFFILPFLTAKGAHSSHRKAAVN